MSSSVQPITAIAKRPFAASTIAADAEWAIEEAPFAGRVSAVEIIPNLAEAGAANDRRTYDVYNRGQAGAGVTKVAELDLTAGVNLVQWDAKAFTLQTTANLVVVAGDVLTLKSTHVGNGLVDPGGLCVITVTKDAASGATTGN